jgi:S-DNA-T family DNA segregation ATPase FtsK/SpoIIIE
MAKSNNRKSERRTPWDEGAPRQPQASSLNPETKQGIVIVVLFLAALLLLLSYVDIAGVVGERLDQFFGWGFGWARYLLPFLLLGIGFALLRPDRVELKGSTYIGLSLFLLSVAGLLHQTIAFESSRSAIDLGQGGGWLGYAVQHPLEGVMGGVATFVILFAVLIISLLVLFNTTLHGLAEKRNWADRIMNRLKFTFYRVKIGLESRREPTIPEARPEFQRREIEGETSEGASVSDQAKGTDAKTQMAMFPSPNRPVQKRVHRKIDLPLDLLEVVNQQPMSGNIDTNKLKVQKTLQTFGIEVEMGEVNVGPTVTQYTLKPAEGVKLAQITTLQNDLSLALAAHPIRIEAPIPGKSLVGIEVPNKASAIVSIREMIDTPAFKNRKTNLSIALGKDVAGTPWVTNLDPMPHLLIAGATGSGKSVCINTIIMSLLYSNSPDDLKFIFIDPKRVELTVYNDIPHLLTPVITDVDKTINALKWVVGEMERRFEILSSTGKRNIQAYHAEVDDGMPYIVVVIDELADLMAVAARDVEGAIIRLAQMARAVGIHLIVATQRPSVDVITGLIKANITARIAFNVASIVDSRTILDMSGAEKLLGKGDMLFISSDLSKPKRVQGAFVSDREISRVVEALKGKAEPEYRSEIVEKPVSGASFDDMEDGADDELLAEAKETILRAGKASASFLQRRLRVGYARAARLLDLLEEQGFIGPGEGAKPREILVRRPDGLEASELDADDEIADDFSGDDSSDASEAFPDDEASDEPKA